MIPTLLNIYNFFKRQFCLAFLAYKIANTSYILSAQFYEYRLPL